MESQTYIDKYLLQTIEIAHKIDKSAIQKVVDTIIEVKKNSGRLFFLGVGGSAANASHAVNDFRKIVGIESYSPSDNVAELTARINDDGWDTSFANWLRGSQLKPQDGVFVLSVGGGNAEKGISNNLVLALEYAKETGAKIMGIVGRDGGHTATVTKSVVLIPVVDPETVTPHTESFQAVIWHMIVSHPALKENEMKWESAIS